MKSAGMPSRPHGSGVALVAAGDEAPTFAPEVDEQRRIAHRRHVAGESGRLGYHVLVGHGHDRDVHSRQLSDLVGVDATGVDDDLALDAALVGLDRPTAPFRPRSRSPAVSVRIVAPRWRAPLASANVSWLGIQVAVGA